MCIQAANYTSEKEYSWFFLEAELIFEYVVCRNTDGKVVWRKSDKNKMRKETVRWWMTFMTNDHRIEN